MRQVTIRVYANPYAHLDHEGRPAGYVLFDPVDHHAYASDNELRRYVGASIDVEKTKILTRAPERSAQSDHQDTVWSFSSEPVVLPLTHYYLDRLRDGELLPADKATALHIGRSFVPYEEAIASAKKGALGKWFRERPDHFVPDWATPADLQNLYHVSDELRAAHAEEHAARFGEQSAAFAASALTEAFANATTGTLHVPPDVGDKADLHHQDEVK